MHSVDSGRTSRKPAYVCAKHGGEDSTIATNTFIGESNFFITLILEAFISLHLRSALAYDGARLIRLQDQCRSRPTKRAVDFEGLRRTAIRLMQVGPGEPSGRSKYRTESVGSEQLRVGAEHTVRLVFQED